MIQLSHITYIANFVHAHHVCQVKSQFMQTSVQMTKVIIVGSQLINQDFLGLR